MSNAFSNKIKRSLWLFNSAELSFNELLVIGCNKTIEFFASVWYGLDSFFQTGEFKLIYRYRKFLPKPSARPKYALVNYFRYPLYKAFDIGTMQSHFSNNGTVMALAQALNELGYVVDVVDLYNHDFKARQKYDLVISPVFDNFERLQNYISAETVFVYFPVVAYRPFVTEGLEARFRAFKERHGVDLPVRDLNNFNRDPNFIAQEESNIAKADGIIVIGDQLAGSFKGFPRVHHLLNGIYFDTKHHKDLSAENLDKHRKNFLFFGGGVDNIRKGLDLAIEAVLGTDLQLYVCSEVHPFLQKKYDIHNQPNIHLLGYLRQRSARFYQIIDLCSFVIQPSSAEGIPGGVLDCMQYGLIPVVSKECNIASDDCAIVLEQTNLSTVRQAMLALSAEPATALAGRARQAVYLAKTKYTPRAFMDAIKQGVEQIVIASSKNKVNKS